MARILITGANRGLGRAIAVLLDKLGHSTVLLGRDAASLEAVKGELRHAAVLPVDLASCEDFDGVVAEAVSVLGGLDGLINNAGTIDPIGPLAQADPAAWRKSITVNLTSPALLMQSALPHLVASRGRIVNISTGAAIKPMAGWSAYCASKAGLLHLSAVVAAEVPEVPCFSLRPGVIDTGMQAAIRESEGMRAPDHQRFLQLHQQGGLEPAEVPAQAAVWLVLHGPAARSGQLIEYTDPEVAAGVKSLMQTG